MVNATIVSGLVLLLSMHASAVERVNNLKSAQDKSTALMAQANAQSAARHKRIEQMQRDREGALKAQDKARGKRFK